jgi:riboflavin synthase
MFTGIVEETGKIVSLTERAEGVRFVVAAAVTAEGTRLGDSIAVNGCCLTVTDLREGTMSFDLLHETVRLTNFKDLRAGSAVNLERALAVGGRLGGHFVQGHIDGASPVVSFAQSGADFRLEVALPSGFAKYAAHKGSIAVNGVSLTIAEAGESSLVIWLIPHTLEVTNLGGLKAGDLVNLEFDMLSKYLERLLQYSKT